MVTPYISRADVAKALKGLLHSIREPDFTALHHLLLVDLLVTSPDMPNGDGIRDFAVRELLVTEITYALSDHRHMLRLDPPYERADRHEARSAIASDSQIGSVSLMAWSMLYYRYVRTDLSFSVETLAETVGADPHTINRYFNVGVRLLTQRLFKVEQEARRAQLQRRLYGALPFSVPVHLIGRDELLHYAEDLLVSLSPCHLQITGATGIGKTMFGQELVRRLIDSETLDQVVWLDQPKSVQYVREQLTELLLREGGEIVLRDYLQTFRVAVVVDGIDAMAADHGAVNALLRDLGAALVCLINRAYVPLETVAAHLVLPELERQDAYRLLAETLRLNHSAEAAYWDEIALELYERVGVIPLRSSWRRDYGSAAIGVQSKVRCSRGCSGRRLLHSTMRNSGHGARWHCFHIRRVSLKWCRSGILRSNVSVR